MRPAINGALVTLAILAVASVLGTVIFLKATGLNARATPGAGEIAVAARLRALAVPSEYARLTNPVFSTWCRSGVEWWWRSVTVRIP